MENDESPIDLMSLKELKKKKKAKRGDQNIHSAINSHGRQHPRNCST